MTRRLAEPEPITASPAGVDETLPTSDRIRTPRTVEVVTRRRDRGVGLCVTSNRPSPGLQMLLEPRLIIAMVALDSGAIVRPDLSIIDERPLPVEFPLQQGDPP